MKVAYSVRLLIATSAMMGIILMKEEVYVNHAMSLRAVKMDVVQQRMGAKNAWTATSKMANNVLNVERH